MADVTNGISRRTLLVSGAGVGTVLAIGGADRASAAGRGLFLARRNKAEVVIVPRELTDFDGTNPQAQLDHTVKTLIDCVRDATGVTLPVRVQSDLDINSAGLPAGRVYVGWPGPDPDAGLQETVNQLDDDGFVIVSDDQRVVILGPSDWGTRFGTYEFCERYLGVRWLMPGADGVDIPQRTVARIPPAHVEEEPDYKGRSFSPLFYEFPDGIDPHAPIWTNEDPQVRWATYNRTRQRGFRRGHNMYEIFPPSMYADPSKPDTYHPEYYAVINGATKLPASAAQSGWQPRFDLQDTIDVAADWVVDYFETYPDRDDVPLCVNDGFGYSDGDYDPTDFNSMGYPSASESYFAWVNSVVDAALLRAPELASKKFMAIAYYYTADAPSFDLRPQIVPIVARDSHAWADPAIRESVKQQMGRWADRCETMTWFDYPYGTPYIAPRLYLQDVAEAYRWAHNHNVTYQYGDAYPDLIGEGPKTWVYNKLLWDTGADVDELTDEWCTRVAGPRGARHLRQYFDFWEEFWTTTALKTPFWAFGGPRTYVFFKLCTYLDAISTADIARLRGHLDDALHAAGAGGQRARVALIRERFRYLEASVTSYPGPIAKPTDDATALALVADVSANLDQRVAAAEERRVIAAAVEADPVMRLRWDHDTTHLWSGFNGETFFHLVDYLAGDEPSGQVRPALEAVAADSTRPQAARFAQLVLRVANGNSPSVVPNGALEEGGPAATPWQLVGNVQREDAIGRDGSGGVRIWTTANPPKPQVEHDLIQRIPIAPGLVASRIWFRLAQPEVRTGVMALKFQYLTATNSSLQQSLQVTRFVSEGDSDWAWIAVMEDVPAVINGTSVDKLMLVSSLLAYDGVSDVHWDDFEAFSESSISE